MHLYLYAADGLEAAHAGRLAHRHDAVRTSLTAGRPVYVDPAGHWAYFNATKQSPLERQLYRVEIATGELRAALGRARLPRAGALRRRPLPGRPVVGHRHAAGDVDPGRRQRRDESSAACAGPSLDLPAVTREFVTVKADDGTDALRAARQAGGLRPGEEVPGGRPLVRRPRPADGVGPLRHHQHLQHHRARHALHAGRLHRLAPRQPRQLRPRPRLRGADRGELGPVALQDQLAGVDYLKTLPYVDTTASAPTASRSAAS